MPGARHRVFLSHSSKDKDFVRELYRRLTRDGDEERFGPEHPYTAHNQANLALVLKDLGQLEEARDLMQMALDSAEKTFEPGHSDIDPRRWNPALILKDLGQIDQARDLMHKAKNT